MDALADLDRTAFEEHVAAATRLLRAMANERRLMILCRLGEGERSVGELARLVGLGQSALSQHLAQLRADGLVATRRQSQTIYYRLDSPEVVAVIRTLATHFCAPAQLNKG
jgi:ArsR family transcriptional regulator